MTIADVRARLVEAIPLSTRRDAICAGLEWLYNGLVWAGIDGELWIDGSFVTEKIDPGDVDVVLRIGDSFTTAATKAQQDVVQLVYADLLAYHCDSYVLVEWPLGHPLYSEGRAAHAYWMGQWGFDHNDEPKGMAVVKLNGGFHV